MTMTTISAVSASLICCFARSAQPETYHGAYAPTQPAVFEAAPNRLLMQAIAERPPGDALDVGMGSGRNALALAERGWRVTGFDIATAGIAQAKAAATARKLPLVALVANDAHFEYGEAKWDLVVLTYQPFRHLLDRVIRSLRPGGLLVIENFHEETARYRLLDRPSAAATNELLKSVAGLKVLRYEDILAAPDWGVEFPVNRLVRLIAEKPRPPAMDCDWKGDPKPAGAEVMWGALRLHCAAGIWGQRKKRKTAAGA